MTAELDLTGSLAPRVTVTVASFMSAYICQSASVGHPCEPRVDNKLEITQTGQPRHVAAHT